MSENSPTLDSIQESCFESFSVLIHEFTGITISKNRKTMLIGRLKRRITALKLTSYESYYEYVKSHPEEKRIFVDLITTNETYFYRTPRIWNYVSQKLIPTWIKNNPGRTFYAWSAAASSGEEAHTLGVLLQSFRDTHPGFQYQILGTDISSEMVKSCQDGVYFGRAIESFKNAQPELFKKYMKEIEPGHFSALPEIKSRMQFLEHNLFKKIVYPQDFDLVLLRNVLIYFTAPDQESVLSVAYSKMKQDSVLIIGESESLTHVKSSFQLVEPLVYSKSKETLFSEKKAV